MMFWLESSYPHAIKHICGGSSTNKLIIYSGTCRSFGFGGGHWPKLEHGHSGEVNGPSDSFFISLATGPTRPLNLELSDTKSMRLRYEPALD